MTDQSGRVQPQPLCPSCWHPWSMHQPEGCWFTVKHGKPDVSMCCPCGQSYIQRAKSAPASTSGRDS